MHLKSFRAGLKNVAEIMLSKISHGNILSPKILRSEIDQMFRSIKYDIPLPTKLESIKCEKIKGEVHFNNHKWSDLMFDIESGRIRKFWEKLGVKNAVSSESEILLRNKLVNNPAKRIADIEDTIDELRPKMKEFDVKINEIEKTLNKRNQTKLYDYAKATAIIAPTSVILSVGIKHVITEMNKAKGCFLYTYNKRCKLTLRSCTNSQPPNNVPSCNPTAIENEKLNLNLMIRKVQMKQDTLISKLIDKLLLNLSDPKERSYIENEIKPKLTNQTIKNNEIEELIEKNNNEDKLNDFYNENESDLKIMNPCDLVERDEEKYPCVACDSSAPHSSVKYIDATYFTDNERSRCEEDPTAWEAIAKMFGDTIHDVADQLLGGSSFLYDVLMYIVYAIVGFIILCGIGYAAQSFRKNKTDNDDDVSYSKLDNEY
nr:putative per os infectivity factor PIF5 isoform 1 [Microplitis mediator]